MCELQGFLHHHVTHLFHIMILRLRKRCSLGSLPLPVSFSSPNTSTVNGLQLRFQPDDIFVAPPSPALNLSVNLTVHFRMGLGSFTSISCFLSGSYELLKFSFYNHSKLTGLAGQIWTHKFLEGFSWLFSGTSRYKHIPLQDQARNSRCSYFESFFFPPISKITEKK